MKSAPFFLVTLYNVDAGMEKNSTAAIPNFNFKIRKHNPQIKKSTSPQIYAIRNCAQPWFG